MITAHFVVDGEERETREVEHKWLSDAWADRDNVLLKDGNTYCIVDVRFSESDARVGLEAPRVARGG